MKIKCMCKKKHEDIPPTPEPTYLYQIKKGSSIKVTLADDTEDIATFHHIDGMYSYCTTSKGGVFHLSTLTPLEWSKEGYYQIVSQAK